MEVTPLWCRDPRFAGKPGRLVNVEDLDAMVESWTRRHSAEDVVQDLQQHGVAAMKVKKVMNIEDQFSDPHLQERQAYAEIEHPHVGIEWLYGMPWRLNDTPGQRAHSGSGLGPT